MVNRTELRSEYLGFIHEYVDKNHCAPRLEEIAQHFGVTEPTAHKMLKSLEKAGHLYFDRDDYSGFYIRLVEWVGTKAPLSEIVVAGGIDRYGVLHDFPKKHGHFPIVMQGYDSDRLFALQAWQHIPSADILANDMMIFDREQEPRIGTICIIPYSNDLLIVQLDKLEEGERFYWSPLAYDVSNSEIFTKYFKKQGVTPAPIAQELILASAIALKRLLTI